MGGNKVGVMMISRRMMPSVRRPRVPVEMSQVFTPCLDQPEAPFYVVARKPMGSVTTAL